MEKEGLETVIILTTVESFCMVLRMDFNEAQFAQKLSCTSHKISC